MYFLLLLASFLPSAFPSELCNGLAELCQKRFDQVVYPTTHNATARRSGKGMVWIISNQDNTVKEQLEDGIRGLMIDVMFYDGIKKEHKGRVFNCHKSCKLGGQTFQSTLKQISDFLMLHPQEVITIILENRVPHKTLQKELEKSGLMDSLYAHPQDKDWPTLKTLIDQNKRLVILTDTQEENSPAWLHHMWDHMVETKYSFKKMSDYDCSYNRGQRSNKLFILNQFITVPLFRKAANRGSNQLDKLIARAKKCKLETGKIPNFFTVDFYNTGDIMRASQKLNLETL